MSDSLYVPRRVARSRFTLVRGIRYHLREWGSEQAPTLVLLHGAQDTSASFQFVVDALQREWHIIAPDWRGHGRTQWTPGSYWMADFLCDLSGLLDTRLPHAVVAIAGHSLGGNVASLYAAARPTRVSRLALIDSLGPAPDRVPVSVMASLQSLLDNLSSVREPRGYASHAEMAASLMRRNPRLDRARAEFVVQPVARALPDGHVGWPHDPTFARSSPSLHTLEDWRDCWRRIEAPVLGLMATEPRPHALGAQAVAERASHFRRISVQTVAGGHNLHFDAPEALARAIEDFLLAP